MYRIGFSKDIHRLIRKRPLILGGINIDYQYGLLAHSDGDVVFHAVGESILGALALGDLGTHFPDTDDKYLNINSEIIVNEVVLLMMSKGYIIENIDISIIAEKPHLATYIEKMRVNIARVLKTNIDNVSIKAGTNEKIDSIGKGKAIEAISIVLLRKKNDE